MAAKKPMKPAAKPPPKPMAKRGAKGDDPSYRPRMTDPVSGKKLVKGKPVPAAFSKDPQPDMGPMPRSATRGVPTPPSIGKGSFSIDTGPSTYAPDPKRPYLQRFTNTESNRQANAVGRMANPSALGDLGGPNPREDALRRGVPIQANYDKSLGTRIFRGIDQLNEGLAMRDKAQGKGDAVKLKKPPMKKVAKKGK